jgi:hypothetical protein
MEKNESPVYWALLALSLAFSALAIVTLSPNPAVSKPNVLGYRSVCSFAPAATVLCGLLAGITCTLRNRVASRRASSMRLVSGQNVDAALAETLFSRVRAAGSTAVDAVSGATASSNVLLKAVADAL